MEINVKSLNAGFAKAVDGLGEIGFWPVEVEGVRHDAWSEKKNIESLFADEKCIAISGKLKVGKSSLLNALLFGGRDVMPTDPTPETVKLTFIHYAEPSEEKFRVVFYTKDEWEETKTAYFNDQQLKQAFEDQCNHSEQLGAFAKDWIGQADFESSDYDRLCEYTSGFDVSKKDQNRGKYTPYVKCVHLYKHSPKLYATMVVDTPGTADPNPVNSQETKKWIGKAICVIYVCQSDTVLKRDQEDFFKQYLNGVPKRHLAIVRNKFDRALNQQYGKNWAPEDAEQMAKMIKEEIKEELCLRDHVFPYSAKFVSDLRFSAFTNALEGFCSEFFGSDVTMCDRFERAVGQLDSLVAAGKDRWEQDKASLEDEIKKYDQTRDELEKKIAALKKQREEWEYEVRQFDTISPDIDRKIRQVKIDATGTLGLTVKLSSRISELVDEYPTCEAMRNEFRPDCECAMNGLILEFVSNQEEIFLNYYHNVAGETFRNSLISLYNRFSEDGSAKKASNVFIFEYQLDQFPNSLKLGKRGIVDIIMHNWDNGLLGIMTGLYDRINETKIKTEVKGMVKRFYIDDVEKRILPYCVKPYEDLKSFIKKEIARFKEMKVRDLESAERVLDAKMNAETEAKALQEVQDKLSRIKKQLEELHKWQREWNETVEKWRLAFQNK